MKKIFILILFPTLLISQTSHTVYSGNFYYDPIDLFINVGDTVFWINDVGFHDVNGNISTETGMSWNNPVSFYLPPTNGPSEIGFYVFTDPGVYNYDCSIGSHAANGMTAQVYVNTPTSLAEHVNSIRLIESYSILGKIHSNRSPSLIINRYSDGTVDKRIIIE
jgi:plastocyanin